MLTRKKMLKWTGLAMGVLLMPVGLMKPLFAGKLGFGAAKGAPKSGKVRIRVPSIAESGANVPVTISGSMSPGEVDSIHIFVDKNPTPWAMSLHMKSGTGKVYISTRVKMGKSSRVRGVIKLKSGKLLQNYQNVKVTVGGCG